MGNRTSVAGYAPPNVINGASTPTRSLNVTEGSVDPLGAVVSTLEIVVVRRVPIYVEPKLDDSVAYGSLTSSSLDGSHGDYWNNSIGHEAADDGDVQEALASSSLERAEFYINCPEEEEGTTEAA